MLLPLLSTLIVAQPQIAYTKGGDLWRTDSLGKAHHKIAGGFVYDRPIEASPDGKYVIVWDHASGHWDLALVEVATGKKLNLTPRIGGGCRMASYSHDGKKIAFMCDDPNGLYIMNADGSGQMQIAKKGHRDNKPLWSKDGKWIVFSDLPDGHANIFIVKPDGTGERALARGSDPVFDASTKAVLYVSAGSIHRLDLKSGSSKPYFSGTNQDTRIPRFFGGQLMYVQSAPGGGEIVQWRIMHVWSKGVRDVVVAPRGNLFALQDDDGLRIVNKQFYPKTIVKGAVGGVAWL